jgi:HSP20 family protein
MANLVLRSNLDHAWDPFRVMDALLRLDPRGTAPGPIADGGARFAPGFDVKETKDAYVIEADLPGVRDQDLAISLTANQLTIAGKREERENEGEAGARYHALERSRGRFARTFVLPDAVDSAQVTANLKDGVLSVHIPKRAEAQPRRIPIGKGGRDAKA